MDIYQLNQVLHESVEGHGWRYRAEVPALQGCVAWGESPEETLKSLLAAAQATSQVLPGKRGLGPYHPRLKIRISTAQNPIPDPVN